MDVQHYKVEEDWFREIVDESHAALKELQAAYEKRGAKQTWLNIFGLSTRGHIKWMLTVNMGRDRRALDRGNVR